MSTELIRRIVASMPGQTCCELAKQFGLRCDTLSGALHRLAKSGKISRRQAAGQRSMKAWRYYSEGKTTKQSTVMVTRSIRYFCRATGETQIKVKVRLFAFRGMELMVHRKVSSTGWGVSHVFTGLGVCPHHMPTMREAVECAVLALDRHWTDMPRILRGQKIVNDPRKEGV